MSQSLLAKRRILLISTFSTNLNLKNFKQNAYRMKFICTIIDQTRTLHQELIMTSINSPSLSTHGHSRIMHKDMIKEEESCSRGHRVPQYAL